MNISGLTRLKRLPRYYSVVCEFINKGKVSISSSDIAKFLIIDDSQVRRDLLSLGCRGKPKIGYELIELKEKLEHKLSLNNRREAFIIGMGNLGIALVKYKMLKSHGLEIKALFDNDISKVGQVISNKEIIHINKLKYYVKEGHNQIAILTVPAIEAKTMEKYLIDANIKAIWNFTPVALSLPKDVIVWNENLADSFTVFSYFINNKCNQIPEKTERAIVS